MDGRLSESLGQDLAAGARVHLPVLNDFPCIIHPNNKRKSGFAVYKREACEHVLDSVREKPTTEKIHAFGATHGKGIFVYVDIHRGVELKPSTIVTTGKCTGANKNKDKVLGRSLLVAVCRVTV